MAKKISKILTLPPILPSLAPEQIIWLLKGQKSKAEELLQKGFLSLEDIQQWNVSTKDVLTKAFGSNSDYIDSILYAGNQRVFSMYEPESILERHRRKNFQASLRLLNNCLDQLEFGKERTKKDISKRMETPQVSESPKISMIHDSDEEEKDHELDEESLKSDENEKMESPEASESGEDFVAQVQEEEKKEFELKKELSKPDISKTKKSMEASESKKVFIALGQEEEKKEFELEKELSKPDVSKTMKSMEASESKKVFIAQGQETEKKELELEKELSKPDMTKRMESMETSESRKVFIVHGQDEEKNEAVARFLTKLDLTPVTLHEQPGQGMALMDKFEHDSEVGFAVIILTGDDYGYPKGKPEESKPRPRQNVIFELGFLMGRYERNCVCALHEEGLELPADYQGAVFIPFDAAGLWKLLIARAMKMANVPIDLNKAI
jgi:predicted nucleotide-binding protein